MQCCRIVNGIKIIKNSLGATWNASHLAPRIKTARRFTAKKPRWQNDFLEGSCINTPKRFLMVGTRHFASATNGWYSIRYHNYGRTYRVWFFAEGEWFLSFWRCHRPRWRGRRWWCGVDDSSMLEIRHAAALTTGAKHWHRQKAGFYVFVSVPPQFLPLKPKKISDNWVKMG